MGAWAYPGTAHFCGYSLLSREGVKLRTSKFVHTIGSIETKPIKNFGKSSRGRTQGLWKIFKAPVYRAHRAVIFAVAQLSCYYYAVTIERVKYINYSRCFA